MTLKKIKLTTMTVIVSLVSMNTMAIAPEATDLKPKEQLIIYKDYETVISHVAFRAFMEASLKRKNANMEMVIYKDTFLKSERQSILAEIVGAIRGKVEAVLEFNEIDADFNELFDKLLTGQSLTDEELETVKVILKKSGAIALTLPQYIVLNELLK